ncbi:Protein-glutamine gamma-glutamyltransferase E [Chelonia mydas]|uniref:protein-glutamine gamma-glutamyltransferase n=1 Tax=Chelonia mydas TaxID=8469 RepID=M7AYS9_CHEMY|nr:Protein-glutamine gamma-glutamyltransferase E [Chelonia mydas]
MRTFKVADLTPTQISWHPKANTSAHHTDRYAHTELIVRRGQVFTITLWFNRPWQTGDNLAFVTEIGPAPSEAHHTKAIFNLSEVGASGWTAVQGPSESSYMNFSISSPANAVIGRYKLSLQITSGNKVSSKFLGHFVLLFNPWCSGAGHASCFQEPQGICLSPVVLLTVLLAARSALLTGAASVPCRLSVPVENWMPGNPNVFQDGILNTCLTMLDLSLYCRQDPVTDAFHRGDPRYVGRVISSMINGNDNDNGVLEGSWDDNFSEHENPSRWNGSVVILRKWRQENYKPVQYGQCWVFAGVMCTVLRCLGIPTRLISNFNSAHDVDGNLSIDKYYDSAGKCLNISRDSSWDYHVWNEVWFIRRDLGTPYSGWQVLDSTPQEQSKGIFQCGPASVRAIKEGDVDLDYDTLFVFTEVNADCNQWIVYKDGTKKKVYCDTERIGKAISTKAMGSNSRVDVTNNYKYPEGSHEEREVYKKACAKARGSHLTERLSEAPNEGSSETVRKPEVSGVFKLVEPPVFGKDINLILILTNLSSEYKPVKVNLSASTILYTRRAVAEILQAATSVDLGSKEEKQIQLKISYAQYEKSLTNDKKILVTALCEVMHTQEAKMLVEKTITLESPTIFIKIPAQVVVHKPVTVEISYANPLPEPVKDCVVLVKLMNQEVKIDVAPLRPKERSKIYLEFTPHRSGAMQLQVDFSCDKFAYVKGFETIDVALAPSSTGISTQNSNGRRRLQELWDSYAQCNAPEVNGCLGTVDTSTDYMHLEHLRGDSHNRLYKNAFYRTDFYKFDLIS